MIQRLLIAAAAVAVGVLGVLWLHSARLQTQAQAIANRPPGELSPKQVAHAVRLFERARANTPDSTPITLEAGLLIRVGRDRQALSMLEPLVRREPQNLTAWVLIADAAGSTDPVLARTAVARARALNPLAARAR